ncbi:hypothetical protein CNMCM5793_000873 [Aspergillus hiratsukae]|uniref:Uncharacterized protein n=1 Tax=Aspergillus hiratsukae TaxID=1194566 RepID=A0A8H6PAX1_9EURO|nr:hypothetical protein CNMCM5793_000873 [Aspergillus hiratsukae]KAF7162690.1 hypothetical protein CNMCM6106_009509 [Aspergillus hiratsukae]
MFESIFLLIPLTTDKVQRSEVLLYDPANPITSLLHHAEITKEAASTTYHPPDIAVSVPPRGRQEAKHIVRRSPKTNGITQVKFMQLVPASQPPVLLDILTGPSLKLYVNPSIQIDLRGPTTSKSSSAWFRKRSVPAIKTMLVTRPTANLQVQCLVVQ